MLRGPIDGILAAKISALLGLVLFFVGALAAKFLDFWKGWLAANAGTDRERADRLRAEVERLAGRVVELTEQLDSAERRNHYLAAINARLVASGGPRPAED